MRTHLHARKETHGRTCTHAHLSHRHAYAQPINMHSCTHANTNAPTHNLCSCPNTHVKRVEIWMCEYERARTAAHRIRIHKNKETKWSGHTRTHDQKHRHAQLHAHASTTTHTRVDVQMTMRGWTPFVFRKLSWVRLTQRRCEASRSPLRTSATPDPTDASRRNRNQRRCHRQGRDPPRDFTRRAICAQPRKFP